MRETLPSGTPVEVARPEGRDATRGLVIACDIGGLRSLFEGMAQQLAERLQWAVAAVEPWRERERAGLTVEERLVSVGRLDDERQVGDLAAAADLLEVEPVGLIGFCMGGMYTLKGAATGRFDRCVSFYGMIHVPEQWKGPGQGDPLDALTAAGVGERVLAIIGTADIWTPAPHVDELEKAGATVVRYKGAEHGFVHDPDRPAHRPADAADAWRRGIDWLTHGRTRDENGTDLS